MKRSDFYIKLTTAALFIAVAVYIGIYLYRAAMSTYETVSAIKYTIEQTLPAQGYIIRTETVLSDADLVALPVVGEGEKVAAGQAIAVEYMNRQALETADEIRELRLLIAQLDASGNVDAAEAARKKTVMDLSSAVLFGDFSRLDELALNVGTNIFSVSPASEYDLQTLKARLDMLETSVSGVRMIYAPVSGTFSQSVDGFENISPDALSDITPAKLGALFSAPSRLPGAYKLVTEFKWYYAALMDADDASRLREERLITLQFFGAYYASQEMLVEFIGKNDGDKCVVLFSSNRSIHELTAYRELNADVVFGVLSGIRVPKEAIQLDDNSSTFVYIQTGARAERVNVEILAETGDSYLVRDGAESGTPLRVGSMIIVRANGLFEGKVVG